MSEALIPISQHFAVWDVHRGSGWVSLHSSGRTVARADVVDIDDFDTIITMLSDRRGLCFDPGREVLRRVAEPVGAARDDWEG
jgi:hypothetical protein